MNDFVTIIGGDFSTLTGGNYSTLTGGDGSVLTGGNYSTLTGGRCSILTWDWWDDANRRRRTVAYVGEDGIEPGVAYKCVNGEVMRVEGADE